MVPRVLQVGVRGFFRLAACFTASMLPAQVSFYSGANAHSNWLAAAGGTPVVLDFESTSSGTQTNNAAFTTYAATAGVVFQPLGNGSYPRVETGQGGIGAIGANWLGNFLNQGYASGNAIAWTFSQPVRAFGFYDVGSDDGFTLNIYSAGLAGLGSFDTTEQSGTPLFWGFVANQDIGKVEVLPRIGNGYIGIDGLSTVAVPEPAAVGAIFGAVALIGAWHRRARPGG